MAGVIFFINALMRHIAGRYGEVGLDFDGVRAAAVIAPAHASARAAME